ncbi:MAG: hypothetical protein GF334_13530 [Candidatus Altiarchaeales archaeon]|nr:hypothetical protein [Candidatus Altiarchaeales archaeon]
MKEIIFILLGIFLLLGCIQSHITERQTTRCEELDEAQCIKTEYCRAISYQCMALGCQPVYIHCENASSSPFRVLHNTSKIEDNVFREFQKRDRVNVIINLKDLGQKGSNLIQQDNVLKDLLGDDISISSESITGKWFAGAITKNGLKKLIIDERIIAVNLDSPIGLVPTEGVPTSYIIHSMNFSKETPDIYLFSLGISSSDSGSPLNLNTTVIILDSREDIVYALGGFGNCSTLDSSDQNYYISSINETSPKGSYYIQGNAYAQICWKSTIKQEKNLLRIIPRVGSTTTKEFSINGGGES